MTSPLSSAGLTRPETSASEQSRMELQAKLNGLGGLNGRHISPEAKAKKLKEACDGFESIFIQKMWQEMRNAVPKTGLLSGREERFWQDMYDQELSKSMTRAGGIGLSDMMYEQLSQNLANVSRTTAGAHTGSPFTPAAAPLVAETEPQDLIDPAPPKTGSVASMYESEAPVAKGGDAVAQDTVNHAAGQNLGHGQPAAMQNAALAAAQPAPIAQAQAYAAATAASQPAKVGAPAPLTAQTPIQTTSLPQEKLAHVSYSPAANTAYENHFSADRVENEHHSRRKAADFNDNQGLLMAQQARRDAGDKLSARSVRPASSRARKQREDRQSRMQAQQQELLAQIQAAQAQQQSSAISQNGMRPGSPDALRAAMSVAKTGLPEQDSTQAAINLHNLVAEVQARNASIQTAAAPGQPVVEAEPQIRRVRRSTNIPQNNNNRHVKNNSQAIRMLNVDNVGANSRQGQGLAAYHAARQDPAQVGAQAAQTAASQAIPGAPIAPAAGNPQAAMPHAAAQQTNAPQAVSPLVAPLPGSESVRAAVPPLTAAHQSAQNTGHAGNLSIPPLTANRG